MGVFMTVKLIINREDFLSVESLAKAFSVLSESSLSKLMTKLGSTAYSSNVLVTVIGNGFQHTVVLESHDVYRFSESIVPYGLEALKVIPSHTDFYGDTYNENLGYYIESMQSNLLIIPGSDIRYKHIDSPDWTFCEDSIAIVITKTPFNKVQFDEANKTFLERFIRSNLETKEKFFTFEIPE